LPDLLAEWEKGRQKQKIKKVETILKKYPETDGKQVST